MVSSKARFTAGKNFSLIALIIVIGALTVIPALAQTDEKSPTNGSTYSEPNNPSSRVDDRILKKVARAFVKVREIAQKESGGMTGSEQNGATDQQVVERAESEKVEAVKAEGLKPQEYNQIMTMVENDKDLKARLMSYVAKYS